MLFMALGLLFLPQTTTRIPTAKCAVSELVPIFHKYYQSGEIIIAGIMSQTAILSDLITFRRHPYQEVFEEFIFMTQNYQHILALVFALKEINDNAQILPNITLGFDIYNDYFSPQFTYQASLKILSTHDKFVPNYKCDAQNNLVTVIGGPNSNIVENIATILGIYKIPQLTYASAPETNNKPEDVFFHWMFPNGAHQYSGILQLLLHFRWTWIGVIYLDIDRSKTFVQDVLPMLSQNGICFDFIKTLPDKGFSNQQSEITEKGFRIINVAIESTANSVLFHGGYQSMINLRFMLKFAQFEDLSVKTKVWIMTAEVDFTSIPFQKSWDIDFIHGSISFAVSSKDVSGFQEFLQMRNPTLEKKDGFLGEFWQQVFDCLLPSSGVDNMDVNICTGKEKLETLPGSVFEMSMTAHSYSIYNAVNLVAHALDAMHSTISNHRTIVNGERWKHLNQQPWQLPHFLKSVSFNISAGEGVSFDRNGELLAGFDIINWITFPNQTFLRAKVGRIDPLVPPDKLLTISDNAIKWPSRFNQNIISMCRINNHQNQRPIKKCKI
ncbi:vomeronasal type-2 receptor 26-like [Rhineura floridana]|uniref:vomeronasal type-2 receptor 26-like n=1 Tax=Rhineura floridana TaxID=261503 RepID=UPI002AC81123|nr:vomeronasal type-2 receptor 26-like [Rhineura floridana]